MKQAFYKLPKIFSQFTNCLISQIDANIYTNNAFLYNYFRSESNAVADWKTLNRLFEWLLPLGIVGTHLCHPLKPHVTITAVMF